MNEYLKPIHNTRTLMCDITTRKYCLTASLSQNICNTSGKEKQFTSKEIMVFGQSFISGGREVITTKIEYCLISFTYAIL